MGLFDFLNKDDEEQQQQPAPMNPVVKDYLMNKMNPQTPLQPADQPSAYEKFNQDYGQEAYNKALAAKNEKESGLGWLQFAAGLGDVIAGQSPSNSARNFQGIRQSIDDSTIGEFNKKKQAALGDVSAKQLLEKDDPNSAESRLHRTMLSKMQPGVYTPEELSKMSANDIVSVMKGAEFKAKLDQSKAQQEMAHEDRLLKNESLKQNLKDKEALKNQDKDRKEALELDKHLSTGWTMRSGQAGAVQGKVNAAEAAEALIDQGKNQKNGLDARQIEELAQSTARLLGGGATASARVDALVPHTLFGRAQSLKEWLSNNPQGSGQEAFVQRMEETVAREKALAQKQMRQYQIEGLAAHSSLKKRNPDLYNSILRSKGIDDSIIDKNGRYKEPKSSESSNPSDSVKMIDPNGVVRMINKDSVKDALAAGGKLAE